MRVRPSPQLTRNFACQPSRYPDKTLRCRQRFTPTSCSWANAVEGLFAKLTRQRLKRDVFTSIVELQTAIKLHRRGQRQAQAVRLDQIRRRHPRRCPAREKSVRSYPLDLHTLSRRTIPKQLY